MPEIEKSTHVIPPWSEHDPVRYGRDTIDALAESQDDADAFEVHWDALVASRREAWGELERNARALADRSSTAAAYVRLADDYRLALVHVGDELEIDQAFLAHQGLGELQQSIVEAEELAEEFERYWRKLPAAPADAVPDQIRALRSGSPDHRAPEEKRSS